MSRRSRAIGLVGVAALCAFASASLAARYRGGIEQSYGPTRSVVVVERELAANRALSASVIDRRLGSRDVPERFIPSDALTAPDQAEGGRPLSAVPAGSYLLVSHLRQPGAGRRELPTRLGAVEVRVAAAGALDRAGTAAPRGMVDVVSALEPGPGREGEVVVLARRVPLLRLRRDPGEGGDWVATLGLTRSQSLRAIEAENFSRQLRLLPSSGVG